MDVKRVVFDLAVYEVQVTDNWCAPDYAKEHFEKGVFIVHDGINFLFCSWGGGSEFVYTVGIPNDVILGVMAKEIKKEAENALSEVLENINDRLSQIEYYRENCTKDISMDEVFEEGAEWMLEQFEEWLRKTGKGQLIGSLNRFLEGRYDR